MRTAGRLAAARPGGAPVDPDPSSLRAVTRPLGGPAAAFDPVALAADGGHLVAGRARVVAGLGTAAVLNLPTGLEDPRALAAVSHWLRSLPNDGPGPVAIGALPFDRGAPAVLVVPRTTWWRGEDGRAWVVRVGPARAAAGSHGWVDDGWADDEAAFAAALAAGGATTTDPGGATTTDRALQACRAVPPGADYARAVRRALGDIASGQLRKVVLGRMVELRLDAMPSPSALLRRLWDGDDAFCPFSVPAGGGRIVGASPELVVARRGAAVASHAFAGTIALDGAGSGREEAARLLASAKDRDEHRLVVEAITGALGPHCADIAVPAAPSVVRLRSDARLGTLIEGTLRAGRRGAPNALELLADLHPTPAVGGVPRQAALERIAALEAAPRGYWAGPVGWVDATGDGEWFLAIRSAVVSGALARVHAGAGIVAGSDPEAELAETTVKLTPVIEALCPGTGRPPATP